MIRKWLVGLALGAFVCPAEAYYIGWEGDCLPEDAGWERSWGDWSGPYHGGAIRTIQDGVMTMDSLYDPGVFDIAVMHRPFNPAPGELFVMEWRLAVDEVVGSGDPGVALFSDDRWVVGFKWDQDSVFNLFDPGLHVVLTPGEFHDYRMTSWSECGTRESRCSATIAGWLGLSMTTTRCSAALTRGCTFP